MACIVAMGCLRATFRGFMQTGGLPPIRSCCPGIQGSAGVLRVDGIMRTCDRNEACSMSRYTLTQVAAERLLKDLDIAVVKTMSRVVADAREHLWLLESISTTDVLTDSDFQRRLCRHVGMRGKLRMRREELFMILDGIRRVPHRNYPDVLMQISELTGQVEKSVASEVLALLEPDQPTIDREVRELMPRYGFQPLPESPLFDECVAYHHCLRQVMEQVLALPLAGVLLARLDQAIGEGAGQLSPLRKLNLLLSGSYRTVALLPNLEAVRRAIPRHQPMPAPQVPPTVTATPSVINTRPGVRLHLCR